MQKLVNIDGYGTYSHFKGYKYVILTKLDQHVNQIKTTAGEKFHNFLWSRFLIIMQNVNVITIGKCNCRLIPMMKSTLLMDNKRRLALPSHLLPNIPGQ